MDIGYFDVFVKLALGLISLIVVINISGKGNLAPTSASDQIQNYVLGGIIGGVIYNPSISIIQYFNILLIWVMLILVLKWLKTNNIVFKKILDGQPITIIKNGKLDVEKCRKAGMSAQDVAFKLRTQGIYSLRKVKLAVLEQNGQLITVEYGEENPKYPVITDGVIQENVLETLDKDKEWLLEKLNELGYENESKIFIAEYDYGKLTIIEY